MLTGRLVRRYSPFVLFAGFLLTTTATGWAGTVELVSRHGLGEGGSSRATGANTLVSRTPASAVSAANRASTEAALSADGRYAVFVSLATDLVAGQADHDVPATEDVFLYDRASGATVLVSHRPGAVASAGDGPSFRPAIAAEGQAVAFASQASYPVFGDFLLTDLFLYDRMSTVNTLVSRHDPSLPSLSLARGAFVAVSPYLDSQRPTVSADGRFVLFASKSWDVVPGQTEPRVEADLFLYDRITRGTTLVTHSTASPLAAASGFAGTISGDGRFVAFMSYATDMVPGQADGNAGTDVFLWDRLSGTTTLVSHAAGSPRTAADQESFQPMVSADGRFVTFTSAASNVVPGQVETFWSFDVFLWDRTTGTSQMVSRSTSGAGASGFFPLLAANGRHVVFQSGAVNLVAGQIDSGGVDLFVFDRVTETITIVSRTPGSPLTAAGTSVSFDYFPTVSADGRFIGFRSKSDQLVAGMPAGEQVNVFLFDQATGGMELASHRHGQASVPGNAEAVEPAISADGRYLAFASGAQNLIAGQTDATWFLDVFLYDRASGENRLVSHRANAPTAGGLRSSSSPRISGDGRFVAFASEADDLIPGQVSSPFVQGPDIFLFDRATGVTELASRSRLSPLAKANRASSPSTSLSLDGSTVSFQSLASDLVEGDFNQQDDIFLFRRSPSQGRFFTLPPCRLQDTREAGQGPVHSGAAETWFVHAACGIPSTARAVSVNVTIVAPTAGGFLTLFAGDQPAPQTSTINFRAGQVRANNAVIPLATNGEGTLGVLTSIGGPGSVHVVLDVNGYFE